MTTYVAEIQDSGRTVDAHGTAVEVATWLAGWRGRPARSVAIWRIDAAGEWHMVDMRSTREQGSAPAGYQGDWRRDPAWDAAVGAT